MIFVDAGPLIGRINTRDQWHDQALAGWSALQRRPQRLITSSLVLAEYGDGVASRRQASIAAERLSAIYDSDLFTVIDPTRADQNEALDWMRRLADQKFGFTDAVSFVLMKNMRIRKAFTFDTHFTIAGFEQWPGG